MRRNSLPIPAVAFVLCVAFAIIAGFLVLHGSDDQANHVSVLGKRVALTRQESFGHYVFAVHCSSCHQLAASHSIGQVGPDLDAQHPSYAKVISMVKYGGAGPYGVMDSGYATGPALSAVASYVSHVANPSAYHP